jgi:hypothetical protein
MSEKQSLSLIEVYQWLEGLTNEVTNLRSHSKGAHLTTPEQVKLH